MVGCSVAYATLVTAHSTIFRKMFSISVNYANLRLQGKSGMESNLQIKLALL